MNLITVIMNLINAHVLNILAISGHGEGKELFDSGVDGVAAACRSTGVIGDETAGLSSLGASRIRCNCCFLIGVQISRKLCIRLTCVEQRVALH